MTPVDILSRLIGFNTVSADSNLALIHYVRELLASRGIASTLVHDDSGQKANLFASIGPSGVPGILLSGHTDVVPAAGQAWSVEPFTATLREGRVYGRGSCDMKGFIAVAIAVMLEAADQPLQRPVHLALSYDEEIGCVGVRRLLDILDQPSLKPFLCLIGEPTNMQFAVGHKGKASYQVCCHGQEAHSSLAPLSVNAIHLASDFVGALRQTQQQLRSSGRQDDAYDVPYSTVHVGTIDGGKALNIVPNRCEMEFEIRHLPGDDVDTLLEQLQQQAEQIVARALTDCPNSKAAIDIQLLNAYPGLDTHPSVEAVRFLAGLAKPDTQQLKVAFGTEGGLFAEHFDVPVVVCGPGSIEQAHKPDEYVELTQLEACQALLRAVVASIS
ncbi:acetylornithine deacetylase [Pokkaliibacter plantistimulans]|uniref:Acetylornithine deacetylase n=2 Tax=Pseudomonadota TaxID=1224 RepID=A0ABX5M2M4_9GAMM|nr:acetylornithine deacetylase [Pokkaliibacter plantistimulans]PPC74024.1 acetylornithine deacetylase [Pokkaliibacter plantistimulans]PXF31140.1 acetylornithine deacetylase [Pokkaliibacter plantistimulans]